MPEVAVIVIVSFAVPELAEVAVDVVVPHDAYSARSLSSGNPLNVKVKLPLQGAVNTYHTSLKLDVNGLSKVEHVNDPDSAPPALIAVALLQRLFAGTATGATAKLRAVPLPQEFEGVTVMFPEPEPTVVVMELVVLDPVQPDGKTHVYVTPATLVTL